MNTDVIDAEIIAECTVDNLLYAVRQVVGICLPTRNKQRSGAIEITANTTGLTLKGAGDSTIALYDFACDAKSMHAIVSVDGQSLFESLKGLRREDRVAVRAGKTTLVLQTRTAEIELKSALIAATQTPDFALGVLQAEVEVTRRVIHEMLDAVVPAIAKEKLRPALHGMHIELSGNKMVLTGCDGQKLAVGSGMTWSFVHGLKCLIARESALQLAQMVSAWNESAVIEFHEEGLKAKAGARVMQAKYMNAKFPAVRTEVPDDVPLVELSAEHLMKAIDAQSAGSDSTCKGVRLTLDSGVLAVGGFGDATEATKIPVEYSDDRVEMYVPASNFQDALIGCDRLKVQIGISGKENACWVKASKFASTTRMVMGMWIT